VRLAALLLLFCAACGGSTKLEGSLGADVSLTYTTVLIQSTPNAIGVVFQTPTPGQSGEDIVLKVTATTTGLDLTKPLTIDLTELVTGGAQRGSVVRVVSGDSRSTLPAIQRGTLIFDDPPAVGTHVSGTLNVLFAAGAAFGSGKTVFGNFDGTVAVPGQ
jgi:hypothetical protein